MKCPSLNILFAPRQVVISNLRRTPCALALSFTFAVMSGGFSAATAHAQQGATARAPVDIPSGPLGRVLASFATTKGVLLSFDAALTEGKSSLGLKGDFSLEEGLARLLAGSGLEAVPRGNAYTLRRLPQGGAALLPEIRVISSSDPSALPKVYAGGQVARGSRMGILGNVDVFETPFSTQSFTEEFARDQQARRVADIIAVDPSVRSAQAEYGDTETYIVRGFPLFVNQVGINGLYGMTEQRRITPEFYERIDVLKGPASMLNGMTPFGVVGGNINLVSKRASDTPLTRFTGSYISNSQLGGHLDIGRRFGPDNAFGVRFNTLARGGDTPVERQEDRMQNAAVALDYRSEKLTASLDITNQDRLTKGQTGNIVYNQGFALPQPIKNDHNFANDWEHIKTNAKYLLAKVEYAFSDAFTPYASFGKSTGEEEYFYAASQMRRITNSAGDFTGRVGGFRGAYDAEAFELGVRGRFMTGSVSNSYAVSYSDFDRTSQGITVNASGVYTGNIYSIPSIARPTVNFMPMLKNGDVHLNSLGVVNTFGFIEDRLLLTLGVRHQELYSGVFSAGVKTKDHNANKLTPTGAMLLKLGRYSLYGNYSEGLAQGATATTGTNNQGEILSPSVTKQGEMGMKYNAGTFGLTAAVFQISQPSTFTNAANFFVADGEQRNRGVELSTFGQPLKGLRLLGGLTLIDAVQAKTRNGINDGKDAVGVPKVNLVLNGEYDLAAMPGLTLTSRLTAFSGAKADVDNTQSIPGWATWDIGGRYTMRVQSKAVTLRANVMNVANKSYWNSVSRGFITMGAPRTFLLSATIDF